MAPVQPSASVAATGLSIRYIGEKPGFAYGYSGPVSITDTETDLLNTTSGSGLIDAIIQFNYAVNSGDDFQYKVYFNDVEVQSYIVANAGQYTSPDNRMRLVIPPFTAVRCTAQNIEGSTGRLQIVSLTGRVYGAE